MAGPGPISAVLFADNGYLQPINIAEISDHAVFYCEKRQPIEIGRMKGTTRADLTIIRPWKLHSKSICSRTNFM